MARGKHARGRRKPPSVRKPQAITAPTPPHTPPASPPSPPPSPPPPQPSPPPSPPSPAPPRTPSPPSAAPFTPPPPTWLPKQPMPPPNCPRTWNVTVQWAPSRGLRFCLLGLHGAYPRYHFEPPEDASVTIDTFPEWLADILLEIWPDMVKSEGDRKESIRFWVYEWNKHGVYSGLTLEDYFLTVRALYHCIPDPAVILAPLGVSQSLSGVRQRFRNAINAEVGVKGFFDGKGKQRVCYVLELSFEMDNHTREFVNAPVLRLGHVKNKVYRVTFPSPWAPLPKEVMARR